MHLCIIQLVGYFGKLNNVSIVNTMIAIFTIDKKQQNEIFFQDLNVWEMEISVQ